MQYLALCHRIQAYTKDSYNFSLNSGRPGWLFVELALRVWQPISIREHANGKGLPWFKLKVINKESSKMATRYLAWLNECGEHEYGSLI
jgi:hypothetical protein